MTETHDPIVYGGPEALFRIEDLRVDGSAARGWMPTGDWLKGARGELGLGSIGVLIDDVLGYATIASAGSGQWSMSTEISLDVFPGLRAPTSRLFGTARVRHADELGSFVTGEVTNDSGELVAVCSQRGRYVPRTWDAVDVAPPPPRRSGADDLESLVGARVSVTDAGAVAQLTAGRSTQNPLGILHGGISLCASDLVASDLVASFTVSDGIPLRTASVRIVYTRAVPADSVVEYRATARHRGRSLALVDVVGSVEGRACTWAQVTAQPG